jgi:cell division septation protein DedD
VASVAPPSSTATTSPALGKYTVQVAAFSDRNKAERLVDKLRDEKYDVYMSSAVTENGVVSHRVRVGRFEKDEDASRIASKLAKDFHDEGAAPFVVKLPE